eukprot:TRINITY_DN548_c0_g1_i1.p1 TRINITY_DN548_c0_g1~~TRINITY_DN548_c0_g1_i1.p1  ORF type:complete len:361 (+),score=48.24 TRINITY_DN548_c0_g1_i1:146-1228(+)
MGETQQRDGEELNQERDGVDIPLLTQDLSTHKMTDLSFVGGYIKKMQQSHDLLAIYYSSWTEKEAGKTTRSLRIFYFLFVLLISLSIATFISAFFITSCDINACHEACIADFDNQVCSISSNGTFRFPYSANADLCARFPGCSLQSPNCTRECALICDINQAGDCASSAMQHVFSAFVIAPFTTVLKFFIRMVLAYLFVAMSCKGYCVFLRKVLGVIFIGAILFVFVVLMVFTSDFLVSILPSFALSLVMSLFVSDPIIIFGLYFLLDRKGLQYICCYCCRIKKREPRRSPTPNYKYVYISVPPPPSPHSPYLQHYALPPPSPHSPYLQQHISASLPTTTQTTPLVEQSTLPPTTPPVQQ